MFPFLGGCSDNWELWYCMSTAGELQQIKKTFVGTINWKAVVEDKYKIETQFNSLWKVFCYHLLLPWYGNVALLWYVWSEIVAVPCVQRISQSGGVDPLQTLPWQGYHNSKYLFLKISMNLSWISHSYILH